MDTERMDAQWFKDTIKQSSFGSQAAFAQAMAKRLGRLFDQPMLSRILSGGRKLQLDEAQAMAEVLKVPLSDVLSRAGLTLPASPKPVPMFDIKSGAILGNTMPPVPSGSAVKYSPFPGQEWVVFIGGLAAPSALQPGKLYLYAEPSGKYGLAFAEKVRGKAKLKGLFSEHVPESLSLLAPVVLIQPS